MDLSNLTPTPWTEEFHDDGRPTGCVWAGNVPLFRPFPHTDADTSDAAFVALARSAFDVMMRRGWSVKRNASKKWVVVDAVNWGRYPTDDAWTDKSLAVLTSWPDPFTAIVEADKWYPDNVDK